MKWRKGERCAELTVERGARGAEAGIRPKRGPQGVGQWEARSVATLLVFAISQA